MDTISKLRELSSQMNLEPAEETGCPELDTRARYSGMVHTAAMPNGRQIKLLKTLLTSACERDCYYCPFRAGRNFRRATLKPEEMAQTFMQMHQVGAVDGLFLSSGIIGGGMRTQDKLIDTAEILRKRHNYRGYLHLKVMPGAERDQVLRAMQLANRVSINLEAPNNSRLLELTPHKTFMEELLAPLGWINEIRSTQSPSLSWEKRWPSSVTQFVVGGAGESDLELRSTTEHLYKTLKLQRAYFSSFNPVADTPLEGLPPAPPIRERRLYQASFLLRDYGFSVEELPFDGAGFLPVETDPKLSWAKQNLSENPIEINLASRRELLRLPGIGPKSAAAILNARSHGKIKGLDDLHRMGITYSTATPFILLDGHRPVHQLSYF
jgi:predicted DNA-binding helix-hairpin-helix protein